MKEIEEYTALKDKTLNEIKRDFKIQTIITVIVSILDLEDLKSLSSLLNKYKVYRKQLNSAFNRGFIPKSKVKEKIEELEKEYKQDLENNSIKAFILKCKIEAIKELLGEE